MQGLRALGYVEGQNLILERRSAEGRVERFGDIVAELVRLKADVIVTYTDAMAQAAKAVTTTLPIVMAGSVDPVGRGIVQSLARPGGNITGFASYDAPIIGKWLQLLKEIAPGVTRVAVLFNPDTAFAPLLNREFEAAPSFGVTVTLAPILDDLEIETAIAAEAREPGGGLVCMPDPFNVTHRDAIIAAATRHNLRLISTQEFPRAGGLMSYWFDPVELFAQAAPYIDRVLRGANPGDLPVQYPTKYSLIINLKTAKELGLTVPLRVLQIADEVIE